MAPIATHRADQKSATWREFLALEEDDPRELIDGELLEVEVPTKWHEAIVSLLTYYLQGWARKHEAGRVLTSGYRVRISENRGVMPDIQVLSEETYRRARPEGLTDGRPELVVEVVSPTSRSYDRVRKLEWYASIGVPEYWIVDPEVRTLERLLLQENRYLIAETAEGNGLFCPKGYDDLELPLAELWAAMEDIQE